MSIRRKHLWIPILAVPLILGCQSRGGESEGMMSIRDRLEQYTTFRLTTDLSVLSDNQREMIPLLIRAAEEMDEIFWMQAWGDKEEVLQDTDRPKREYLGINYGPWDRIEDN